MQRYVGCKYTIWNCRIMRDCINCKIGQIETGYIQNLQETGHKEPKRAKVSQKGPKLLKNCTRSVSKWPKSSWSKWRQVWES